MQNYTKLVIFVTIITLSIWNVFVAEPAVIILMHQQNVNAQAIFR